MLVRIRLLAVVFLHLAFVIAVHAAPLSGTKSIGPTGDYASLTAAIADIKLQTLGGPLVLELQPAYVSTVETFPVSFTSLGTTVVNTLIVRPQSGATALSITSNNGTATVDLNGSSYVTLDGRPGGTGTVKQLTIANTGTTGAALRFINGASNELVQYVKFQGMALTNSVGVIFFAITSGANGNQNSTVDHCDIGDGVTTPTNAIYSAGSSGTLAQYNSGNTISNCNIFNFYAAANVDSAGVWLSTGNTGWTISGNSFYQTASRPSVSASVRAIYINTTSGNNFAVTGNFIGGSAVNAGGSPWTATNTANSYFFVGIQLNVGSTTPSSIQGNTIANIVWASSSAASTLPGVWSGIYVQAGNVNIGTMVGNTIGSGAGTGSVSILTQGNGGTGFGIGSVSSGTATIANNTIGSITVNGTTTSVSASLTGIQVTAGTNSISNNTVGSAGTPNPLTGNLNSLNAATSSTSGTGQQVTGILSSSNTSASITGNTVANLNNNYAGTATTGQILGIVTTNGVNTIIGNVVRNLSTTSLNTNSTTAQSVLGISDLPAPTASGQTVSQNTVHSLANTAVAAGGSVTGICFGGPINGMNLIARNLVHSLAVPSSGTSSQLNGMYFDSGIFTAQNNMVRVGLQADGTSTAGASIVRGIFDNGTDSGRNFYHNSIYLGGTQTSGASNTRAFESSVSVNARTVQNNIFVNARNNNGAASKHYVFYYGSAGIQYLTAGGNLFLASGTGGVLGNFLGDLTTLAAWRLATGQDATSAVADPLFIAPAGTAVTVDLHLQASNPAEGQGIPLTDAQTATPATVTDDFDGQMRSTLTPVDIGADAGNFTLSSDVFAPIISYPLLTSGSTGNRVLTGWATITDNVGVASGGNAPRLYFKKSTDADVFGVTNNSTGNGWKYVTASGSGPYSFTLDYSIINGGGVSVGDTIQYFVVAQDAANNLVSSPANATASANPPVQHVNGYHAVNSFNIVSGTLSGTVTVGSGGTYPSLSGASGLFATLNGPVLTGNMVVNITSDLTEDGSVILHQLNSDNYPQPTVTIQPDSATMRTISGSIANGLITLGGANRVIIDGSFGGSGRYLTLRNTNTSPSANTIRFQNDASNNIVRNCFVEGAGSVILFGSGTVTGNDNNLISGCQVRDLSNATGVPQNLIYSSGISGPLANSGNTVSNNELFNFTNSGIWIDSSGNTLWTLSGNEIHEVNASTVSAGSCIVMKGYGANIITRNFIHDMLTTGTSSSCIYFSGTGTTTISQNRITAFNVSTAPTTVYGILAQGSAGSTLNVLNNQITISFISAYTSLYGIFDHGSAGSVVNVFFNSIAIGGTESGTGRSLASLRDRATTHTAQDNIFLNLRTGGANPSHFAAGSEVAGGNYTVSNNVYAGTSATAAYFMDFSTNGLTNPVTFATWQSSTGDTASQAGNAGSGSFTSAIFVNAATGDLHLVPGGSALVNRLGTPIAGVAVDYDDDSRSATTPTIGADEIPLSDIAITQTSALTDGVSSVDFGSITLGSSSTALTFTITNPGTADLTSLAITEDGPNAGDFTISALSGTTVPATGGSVTFTVTFTPGASGARSAAIHIASNVTGTKNPFDIALTGTGLSMLQNWRQVWFGTTSNSGNAADAADPYHTGVPNLAAFAVLGPGQNPANAAAGLLPQPQMSGGNYSITFTQPTGVTGVAYGAEWTADLSSGNWTPIADTGVAPQHIFSVPIGSTNLFLRLRVTEQ